MTAETLDKNKLPRHVAIIMDGNGRWAQARGLTRTEGHRAGAESVRSILRASRELGIGYLTVFAFSSENWGRPKKEVDFLMRLMNRYIKSEIKEIEENGIRLNVIGDLDRVPRVQRTLVLDAIKQTAHNQDMVFTVALSYGGRQEILRAARDVGRACQEGRLDPESLTEEAFARHLYTDGLPDPDLLIRTSGEQRISNFLLWQLAYAELYFTPTYWPAFRKEEYLRILMDFQERDRRFGLLREQDPPPKER
jgi:undecaprenyl diphosphate synthase